MYFALKSDCYFRRYDNIGLITRPTILMEEVVNEYGAIFLEQLRYQPREINDIVHNLSELFTNVEITELTQDALDFYSHLAQNGFLTNDGKTQQFEYSMPNANFASKSSNAQPMEPPPHFLKEFLAENPHLVSFHIELTSKCNERCVHCYIPHEKKDTDISYALMMKTLNQCKEMGVLTVSFSGGEPLLHPHFCTFLRYAKDLDLDVVVLTNLTVLTDEMIDALCYRHASCVKVSLYSMNPEIHDTITTVKGSFETTKKNILKLIENNVVVQINCPVMKQNKSSFHEVMKWGRDHDCRVVIDYLIMARFDRTTDNLNNRLTANDIEDVVRAIMENDVAFQTNALSRQPNRKDIQPNDNVCGVGISTLSMAADGTVYPCAGWQKYVCGNLKVNSLQEIWDNSPQVRYLRSLRQKDFKKCIDCDDRNYCLMCMSRNSNEDPNGDIFNIPQITCDAAHIYHEIVEKYMGESAG